MKTLTLEDPADNLIYREGSGGTVEIYDIVVGSERGVGKGRALVKRLLDEVQDRTNLIFAITRASNHRAQQFYAHCGFRFVGSLHSFYDGEDAIVFGLDV